jgi:hypothetical protein
LVTLRRRVDDHFDAALSRAAGAMRCRIGCDQCCRVRLSVFAIEGDRIAHALAALDPALREHVRAQAGDASHCALLVDGRCVVYEQRPLICRSHGVPARADGETSCCPLNFVDAPADPASVLNLDAINLPLSVMARMHDGEGRRVALAELATATTR